jgi:PKD repeat protein
MRLLPAYLVLFILQVVSDQSFGQENARSVRPSGIKTGIAPLLGTHWEQGCFYNASCPTDTASHNTCLHVPSGSGAVAMAQIMNYYQFPAHGSGEHGYAHPDYGIQYANFGATNYDWANMPDSVNSGHEGLATLIYQCGVAQNMDYGSNQSVSLANELDTALIKYFTYPKTAVWKSKSDFQATEWLGMLKAELDAHHPLIYSGTDITGSIRHYFICDGYQEGDLFHFNYGLGSDKDGYSTLDNIMADTISVSNNQQALFNLTPVQPGTGSYIMDFESVPDFSLSFNDWTVKDVDLQDTYGITGFSFPHQTEPMAFLNFNPALVTPTMSADQAIQPHSGQRFGACFSSNPPANNDWFISPQIQLGTNGSFSFWIKSYTDFYGLDTYTVAVSVTDNNPASFTTISGAQPLQTTLDWTKKTFALSGFNNQAVYIAIHCVSEDHFLMMIDDLEVKPQESSALTADFTADKTTLRVGETVSFSDLSSGMPDSWYWTFTGAVPSGSTLQNPAGIKYSIPGIYPVSLKVAKGSAADSITKTGYITVNGYPTYLTLDFESLSDFNLNFYPWTVIDVKGGNTYGIQFVSFPNDYQPMAYICFNPAQTIPPLLNMQAHSGAKLGCCFSSVPATPPLPATAPNDKWLISPKMSLGLNPQIEFWVKTYSPQYGNEKYNVAVSATDLNPLSFAPLTGEPEAAPSDWTRKTYSLSNYSNQDVYVGIQCVTNDGYIFMLDDISITSSLGVSGSNLPLQLTVYPNPAEDHLIIYCPKDMSTPFSLTLTSLPGEQMASWQKVPVSGKIILDIHDIPTGVYLLAIVSGINEVIHKVSIINK